MIIDMSDAAGPALAAFAAASTAVHLATCCLAVVKTMRPARETHDGLDCVPVTLIRPVCGLEDVEKETLASTFTLEHAALDVIFCATHERDPAVAYVRQLMAAHPHVKAQILIGDERPTSNPKLNNILKGWRAAEAPWIIMADSNVLMPPRYVEHLLATWDKGTGLVCSPPVGAAPQGIWGELECAFLNAYQARWQLSADAVGFAFAQGKSMLWRRTDLEASGGVTALGAEIAEDAAATKIVRSRGLDVRLVDRPFAQLIGKRTLRQVWDRQVRWARLRRATFLPFYIPEAATGSVLPTLAAAAAAVEAGTNPWAAVVTLQAIWLASEAVVNRAAGWHMTLLSPLAWGLRDLMLPVLWLAGLSGNTFSWRGTAMSVAREDEKPIQI